jgi:hypothetical protein
MSQKELLDYIKPNLEKGFSAELLKAELLKAGWEETAVNEAFSSLEKPADKQFEQVAGDQEKESIKIEPKKELDMEPNFSPNTNASLELGSVQALNMVDEVEKKENKAAVANHQGSNTKDLEKDLKKEEDRKIETKKKEAKGKMNFSLKPKLKLALIIILSLIVLGALAFFAYARFQDSPMKVLEKSLLAMEEVSSFEYNLEIKGEYQWKDGDFSDFMALLGGSEDESQTSVVSPSKHQASLSLNGYSSTQASNLDSRLDISFSSGEMKDGEKINIETRFIQDQAYLRLSLPTVEIIDFSVLENKWLQVPLEQEGADIFSDFSLSDGLDSGTVMAEDSSSKNNNLTEDLWEKGNKLKEAIVKHEPFKVVDTFSGSLASGQKTYHYILEFDKKALENVLLELYLKEGDNREEVVQEIREDMENIEIISGELVAGRDDFFMHNFSLSLTMKEGAYSDDKLQILSLNFDLSLQSFNQPINVVAPENSVALEEVMGELFEAFLADSFGPELDWDDYDEGGLLIDDGFFDEDNNLDDNDLGMDMELDSDLDGLTDYEEINIYGTDPFNSDTDGDGLTDYEEINIYGTDPLKSDTDGDSYPDGEEVLNGYNPLGEGLLDNAY